MRDGFMLSFERAYHEYQRATPCDPVQTDTPSQPNSLSRREFILTSGAAASAFTIVPRHVLGGTGYVAPSEKITLACIGFGTQAIREIGGILASPDVQIVAVCDVEKNGSHYLEWSKDDVRDGIGDRPEPDLERGR